MKKSPLKRRTPLKAKPFAKSSWKKGKKTLQGSGLKQRKNVGKGASLKSRSKKRDTELREYSRLRKAYLAERPFCLVHLVGCQGEATEVHHRGRRYGRLLNLVEHWLPVCRFCHTYIENHGKEAREKGWIYSI